MIPSLLAFDPLSPTLTSTEVEIAPVTGFVLREKTLFGGPSVVPNELREEMRQVLKNPPQFESPKHRLLWARYTLDLADCIFRAGDLDRPPAVRQIYHGAAVLLLERMKSAKTAFRSVPPSIARKPDWR